MRKDKKVICIGEDIGIEGGTGGSQGIYLSLVEEFGHERIIDTPISEIAIAGCGIGAAIADMKVIVDLQYGDFIFCMMDQIVNEAAKITYMSGGKVKMPLTILAPVGASGRGAQHGQSPEGFFIHVPGLQVAVPSNPYDAKGLMKTAIRSEYPTIIFLHKLLCGAKGARKEEGAKSIEQGIPEFEYLIPFGKAIIKREGKDVTILAKLLMVFKAIEAAEVLKKEGIDLEIIDPRTLVPLDEDLIIKSIKKTGRLVVVDEDNGRGSWASEVSAVLGEKAFDYLDAPIKRVTAPNTPVPNSPILENEYVPSVDKIIKAIKEIL
ncbi:MAG: alpha-ketoacid dehydrogenase subunit beta [Actinobacteria bacterium]|nr:alpha-ketoacid dehydrogenase subunit beta [Actinomycetota bacterium]MCL5071921.1 alpha-ketoacid dehydrogenase subunit beta [Actinomycetota bacterium]